MVSTKHFVAMLSVMMVCGQQSSRSLLRGMSTRSRSVLPLSLMRPRTLGRGSMLRGFAEKINTEIDLEAPKVVTMEDLKVGEKKVYCRCWKSGTFPLCDGTHAKWNKETGDNVGPLIVKGVAAEGE
mmetsp:Transcript_23405/g.35059  ORF Transcript_23405/g.35059 Transcript_23405/m.35059 type:complete len:126 (+) Transcript_23405:129-506(+)